MPTRPLLLAGLALMWVAHAPPADACPPLNMAPHRPPPPPQSVPVAPTQDEVEVWVDLSEPPLASLPRDSIDERAALRSRIAQQQEEVMAQLALLGAVEQARVQQVRNALAVALPAAALEQARQIEGVLAVRAVKHIRRHTP